MHFTEIPLLKTALLFTHGHTNRTSAHYVISGPELSPQVESGHIIQFVSNQHIAWHAGLSAWQGLQGLNATSIGIEHINPGPHRHKVGAALWSPLQTQRDIHGAYWSCYDTAQIQASIALAHTLVQRYHILPTHVLAHADIAPTRKCDPGPLFPWAAFAKAGVGAWLSAEECSPERVRQLWQQQCHTPFPGSPDEVWFLKQLAHYGYAVKPQYPLTEAHNAAAFKAFKAHFSGNGDLTHYGRVHLEMRDMLWLGGLCLKYASMLENSRPHAQN